MAVDRTNARVVEILLRKHPDGWRIWVNIDGSLACRAYCVDNVVIDAPHSDRMSFDMLVRDEDPDEPDEMD